MWVQCCQALVKIGRLTVEMAVPAARRQLPGNDLEQGRLAAAISADHADALLSAEIEGDRRGAGTKGKAQVFQIQHAAWRCR